MSHCLSHLPVGVHLEQRIVIRRQSQAGHNLHESLSITSASRSSPGIQKSYQTSATSQPQPPRVTVYHICQYDFTWNTKKLSDICHQPATTSTSHCLSHLPVGVHLEQRIVIRRQSQAGHNLHESLSITSASRSSPGTENSYHTSVTSRPQPPRVTVYHICQ